MRAATSTSEVLINPRQVTMASVPGSKSCARCWGNYGKAQQMCFRKHTQIKKELSNIVDSNQDQIIHNPDFLRIAKTTFKVQRDVIEAQRQQKYDFDTKEKREKLNENDSIWNHKVGERNDLFNEYLQHMDNHSIDNKTNKDGKLTESVDEDKHLVKFGIRDFANNFKNNENVSDYSDDTCMDTLSASMIRVSNSDWAERKSNDFLKQLNHIINDTVVPSHKNKIHNEARDEATKQGKEERKDQLQNYDCEEMFTKTNLESRDDDNKDFQYLFPQLLISAKTDAQVSSSELIQKTREVLDAQLAEKARKISIENRKRKEFESLQRDKKLHKSEKYYLNTKTNEETEASKEQAHKEMHSDLDEQKMSHEKLEEVSLNKSKRETDAKMSLKSAEDKNSDYKSKSSKLRGTDTRSGKDVEKNEDTIPISGRTLKSDKSAHTSEKDKEIKKIKGEDESKSEKVRLQSEPRGKKEKSEIEKNKYDDMLKGTSNIKKDKVEAKDKNEAKIPISGGQLKSDKSAKMSERDKEIQKIKGGDESISEKVKQQSKPDGPKAPNVIKEMKTKPKKTEEPINLKSIKMKSSLPDIPKVNAAGSMSAKVPDKHVKNQEYPDAALKQQQVLDKKSAEEESKRLEKEKEARKESKNKKTKDIDLKSIKMKSSLPDIPKVNVAGLSEKVTDKNIKNQEYPDAELKKQQILANKSAEEAKRLKEKESRNNKTKGNAPEKHIDLKSIKIKSSLSDIPKVNVAGLSATVPDKNVNYQEYLKQQQLLDKRAAEENARRLEAEKEEASEAEKTTESEISNNANMSIDDIFVKRNVLARTRSKKAEVTEQTVKPVLFHASYQTEEVKDTLSLDTVHDKEEAKKMRKESEPIVGQGMRYALSDRSFIEKGWTLLPTEKIVRKMNVYRMRPAHAEFDWFEHNKHKGQMLYDTGERLADFNDKGRGRWFYRNGNVALEYYDTEDATSQQRFVVYSSGEPDERGRSQPPKKILATFDNNGNGIVFDHTGKIRLKYNQTEGVMLDKSLGPVSNWKWHSLNDPPVLNQVMVDTHLPHKDARIMKLENKDQKLPKPDNADMLAIEFDNFIKEKSKKMNETEYKPFQIKIKALKINENFSLRVLDQKTVHLLFRDGKTNLNLNLGMILDQTEIVDTETAEVGEVTTSVEKLPAQTDSVAELQQLVEQAARAERARVDRCRRLRPPAPVCSRDRLVAAASRGPPRCPLGAGAADCPGGLCCCHERRATTTPVYYNNQLM